MGHDRESGFGSNAWAVAGSASTDGRSLLAGTAALLALSLLLLPQPSRGLSTGAAFQSFAQPNSLSHTLRIRQKIGVPFLFLMALAL